MENTRASEIASPIPLDVVGSTTFGRYPQISLSETFNMFIVIDKNEVGEEKKALIPFAGYQSQLSLGGNGRGLFGSFKANLMFSVATNEAYAISDSLNPSFIGNVDSTQGDVFSDEDILGNIAFCDGFNIYIYNYNTGVFYKAGTNPYAVGTVSQSGFTVTGVGTAFNAGSPVANVVAGSTIYFDDGTNSVITNVGSLTTLTVSSSITKASMGYVIMAPLAFTPNYVCFHDSRFIATSAYSNGNQVGQWRLSRVITSSGGKSYISFPGLAQLPQLQGTFQTKPDLPIAVVRIPGRANTIIIMGSISSEIWTDVGAALFPYKKNQSFNLDYGCVNPSTIATLGELVVWVGQNEKSGLVIMYTTGQDIVPLDIDGIDYRLANIKFPKLSYGFMFKQDGHTFYIVTFYEPSDNVTYMYDFKKSKFYTLTDEQFNYFIAKHAVFFNNTYYFNSINDGDIYEINSNFTTYEYAGNVVQEIPRARVCNTIRTKSSIPKVANNLTLTLEQGVDTLNTQEGSNISTIGIVENGSGYTTATVIIDGDGSGAYAMASVVGGVIFSVTLVDPGIGYSWAIATISGDGTGAQLETTLNVASYLPRIDLCMSYDGGYTFSSFISADMYAVGKYQSRIVFNELGYSNEFTPQLRFYGQSRFVINDAEMNFYE